LQFEGQPGKTMMVVITDFRGQKIFTQRLMKSDFTKNTVSIKLPGLRKGLYVVQLKADNRIYHSRFFVE
ncbi:MAG TPA: T9SS type A sorting domain-containing protein, partial [Chryseosolibacter sp.]|nr:T9SS type A sorting domain-containing protein [Chryseosolibacter sp.]